VSIFFRARALPTRLAARMADASSPPEGPLAPQCVVLNDMVGDDEEWEDDEEEYEDDDDVLPPHWIPYNRRAEWADVEPIPQDDGPFSVVKIDYTDEFRHTMDYFRAVMRSGEKSQRALDLTADVVRLNSANYVGWWYRRQCLFALGADLELELDWLVDRLFACLKNYQMWYHRRVLLTRTPTPNVAKEKRLISRALPRAGDSKNAHAWCHRRWLVQHFKAHDGEWAWVTGMIDADVRNNSAWNYRYFLVESHLLVGLDGDERYKWLHNDLRDVADWLRGVPHNESPYNYAFGLCRLMPLPHGARLLRELLEVLSAISHEHPACSLSRATALQCLERAATFSDQRSLLDADTATWVGSKASNYKDALQIVQELQRIDGLRASYWAYHSERLEGILRPLDP